LEFEQNTFVEDLIKNEDLFAGGIT